MSYVDFMKGLFVGIEETSRYFSRLHVDNIEQVEKAYKALRMQGIKAEIYGKPFEEIVKELYEIVKRYCSDSFL